MILRNLALSPHELKKKENDLLDEWAHVVPGFIRDGVVNEEYYCMAPIKILVVLKEVNGGSDWDLRKFLREGGRAQTWNVVARWVENIFSLQKDFPWRELQENNDARRASVLQHIGAINVKKTSGKAVADNKAIRAAAKKNKEYLRRQIELYCPDIVICGGTSDLYVKATNAEPNWKMTSRGIWYFIEDSGTVVISYSHPEARTKECLLHYGLIDAVREILSSKENKTKD